MMEGPMSYDNGHYGQQYSHDNNSPVNSDGNYYQSPMISPGQWNASPSSSNYATISPQSHASIHGSPNSKTSVEIRSSPPSTPPSSLQTPALPSELGGQGLQKEAEKSDRRSQEKLRRQFLDKSVFDQEREKIANRRVQSMMIQATRRNRRDDETFGKHEARSFLVSSGGEAFATSSRKTQQEPMVMEDLKGSVNDFKCQQDRGRERAAKFHAMRIITRLDNAA